MGEKKKIGSFFLSKAMMTYLNIAPGSLGET